MKAIGIKKIVKIIVLTLLGLSVIISLLVYTMADKIEAGILKEVNKKLAVEGSYKKAGVVFWKTFPRVSIELTELVLKESTPITEEPLITAKKLYLQLNIFKALRGNYELSRVKGEQVHLYMALKNKQNNFTLFKEDTTQSSQEAFQINLKSIAFSDLHFKYADWDDQDFIDLEFDWLQTEGKLDPSSVYFAIEAKAHSHYITLSNEDWAKDKELQINTKLHYNIDQEVLSIEKGSLSIFSTQFNLDGMLALGNRDSINLQLETRGSEIQVLAGLLPQSMATPLQKYKSSGGFSANIHLYGSFKNNASPNIDAHVKILDGTLTPPGSNTRMEQIHVHMRYLDLYGQEALIQIPNLSFTIENQSIKARLDIHNPEFPRVDGQVEGSLNLESLSAFLPQGSPQMSGHIECGFKVQGLIEQMGTQYFTDRGLDGFIQCKNVSLSLPIPSPEQPLELQNCNGKWELQGNSIFSNAFNGKLNGQNWNLAARIENLLPYWFQNKKLRIGGNLELQGFEWKDPNRVGPKHNSNPENQEPTDLFELFPQNIEMDMEVKLGSLQYNNAQWKNGSVQVLANHKKIDLRNFELHMAGGKVMGNAFATPRENNQVYLNVKCEANQIRVEQLLKDLDNLGQNEITSENLSGTLSFKTQCVILIDRNGTINKEDIYAFSEVKIEEGALKNYEAMRSLSDYAEVKELEHIRFSTLENTFEVREGQINFPFMFMGSNVLNLSIKGKHHFDNYMDYTFKIKLSDALAAKYKIRSRKAADDFEDLGNKGVALYINMTGYADDLKFSLQKVGGRPVIIPEKVAEEAKQARKEFKEVIGREFSEEKRIKEKERQAEEENIEWDEW